MPNPRTAWNYRRRLMQQRLGAMKNRRKSSSSGSSRPSGAQTNPFYSGPYGPEAAGQGAQKRRAQQSYAMTLAQLYHDYPLQRQNVSSEAAARGAYESPGRHQALSELDWQLQMGLMQAMLEYQNATARQ